MTFDPCPEQKVQIILKAGRVIRKLMGLPEENNITLLYNETALLLDISVHPMNSSAVDHLPAPSEMKGKNGHFTVPRENCPVCGKENSFRLDPLCLSCEDAEGGKYKSMWFCGERERGTKDLVSGSGCGHKERIQESLVQYCRKNNIEVPFGFKKDTGIETLTDEGLK